ncbi:PH domain-containing protein [Idiomarina sp.]|uniref:PH domain-containing protein n=1 Tax=Idiomarina sp. TaxID=1874361 RepID=UPI0025C7226D|nr:PH domain-containing protein [Idiomarina sp.]
MNKQRENSHQEPFFGDKKGAELSSESAASSELQDSSLLSGIPEYKNPRDLEDSRAEPHILDEPPTPTPVFRDPQDDITQASDNGTQAPLNPETSSGTAHASQTEQQAEPAPEQPNSEPQTPRSTVDTTNQEKPNDDDPLMIVKPSIRGCWPDLLTGFTIVFLLFFLADPLVQGYVEIFTDATVDDISAFNSLVNKIGFYGVLCTAVLVYLRILFVQHNEKIFLGATYVELHKGIIARDRTRINLDHIRSVDTKQGLIDRLLNIGSVHLSTAGTSESEVTVTKILDPLQVRNSIKEQQLQMMKPKSRTLD